MSEFQKVYGDFIADGNAVNLDIGFVPDKFTATAKVQDTNAIDYEWFKSRAGTSSQDGQYGMVRAAGGGAHTKLGSASGGFQAYDTKVLKAMLPAPNGNGETSATIYGSFATAKSDGLTPTARTSSIVGTVIRPTLANGFLYECTTQGGAMTALTEPTFSTVLGATTSDGSNTWTTREEKLKNVGAKGITIGADIGTDSDEWTWEAETNGSVATERDAASYDPVGKYPNN